MYICNGKEEGEGEKKKEKEAYDDFHLRITIPHNRNQRIKSLNNIRNRFVLLHNIIGTEMHGNHICGILLQPANQLLVIRDVDGQEA